MVSICKVIGLLLILAAATGIGLKSSMELSGKEQLFEELLQMILLLKGEIRYGKVTIREACLDVSVRMQGACGRFLKSLAGQMPCGDFGELFASCADRCFLTEGLTAGELEPLYLLGKRLGYLDTDMQLRQLELCEEELRQTLARMQREFPQKQKLYRSLGVLGGLMLALLLW